MTTNSTPIDSTVVRVPEQWTYTPTECLSCGAEWVAVYPLGADKLECFHCGSTDTIPKEKANG